MDFVHMSSFKSVAVAAVLAALAGACQVPGAPTARPSGVEIVVASLPASELVAAPMAALTIRGLDNGLLTTEPLAAAGSVRRTLPPGVYSVGWSGLRADTGAPVAPVVTRVLPGRLTTVHVGRAVSTPCSTTVAALSSELL
jgi:hypothetical protein